MDPKAIYFGLSSLLYCCTTVCKFPRKRKSVQRLQQYDYHNARVARLLALVTLVTLVTLIGYTPYPVSEL